MVVTCSPACQKADIDLERSIREARVASVLMYNLLRLECKLPNCVAEADVHEHMSVSLDGICES